MLGLMVTIREITTGTTGPNQNVVKIEIASDDRTIGAFATFLPEGRAQRPDLLSDEALTDDEKEAYLNWLNQRWPNNSFLYPADYRVKVMKR